MSMNIAGQSFARPMVDETASSRRLTICFPFSGENIGGSHVSVIGLLELLDKGRFRPIVVPEVPDGKMARFFTGFEQLPDPVQAGRMFVPGEAFGIGKFLGTLFGILPRARFLRRHGIDIVHVNDGRTSANWAVAARLAGARLVWHHRGDPDALGLRLAAPLLADRVLTVSSFALPKPGLWSAARKAAVVHSPFDVELRADRKQARAILDEELGLSPDTIVLGFFGAFVPRKRPLMFVDAIRALRAKLDRPVIGLLFGEARVPEMDKALRDHIAATGVSDCVRIMGYRSPGPQWIAACDQLLVPAIGEPFGRTLIEAMLVGTPVIATRSGGNVEALEGGFGVLVAPDDADAMAEGCARVVRNPALAAEMVAAADRDARNRFSTATHCALVSETYAKLA
jgi:glycosyltransferase involved in cell wall biosynthesis